MNTVKKEFLRKDLLKLAKGRKEVKKGDMVLGHNQIRKNLLTVKLAPIWGFCYGVLYAIEEVGEALEENPDKNIWVLGELIHNPRVNRELQNLGAHFINFNEIDRIRDGDVVVIPAFGTRKNVLKHLQNRKLTLIDTTCPEVRTVEEQVKKFNQEGYTAIIHGKYSHQESIATSSYADKYLIVRNLSETEYVCDYMLEGGNREDFMEKFNRASSSGFNPDRDLEKIGVANQTTMLMNESLKIFNKFEETVRRRDKNSENFCSIKTICSATQDRQDAVKKLLKNNKFDLFIVVGGHNSSNTQNLARTVTDNSATAVYHIENAGCFTRKSIEFLPPDVEDTRQEKNWLPEGKIKVGLTAGASTPHSQLESVLEKLLGFY